jgi:hypothetical protein
MWYNNYILKEASLTKLVDYSKEICDELIAKSINSRVSKKSLLNP